MGFYLSLVQVVFMLSNSASFFTRRRGVPRPWNFFLSWIRAQTTPVFTTNCTILFVNFTADCTIFFSTLQQNVQYFFFNFAADCTISDKQQTAVLSRPAQNLARKSRRVLEVSSKGVPRKRFLPPDSLEKNENEDNFAKGWKPHDFEKGKISTKSYHRPRLNPNSWWEWLFHRLWPCWIF